MNLFYSKDINGSICRLDKDESTHCIKVLRHKVGDKISVIDGDGVLYNCEITNDSFKQVQAKVLESIPNWNVYKYKLHMAVCPPKNTDRYEWFAEKASEMGFNKLSPIIGEHSERKVFKSARIERILISAAKQSLKGLVPKVAETTSVKEFIKLEAKNIEALKFIAYCFEDEKTPRISIKEALQKYANLQEYRGQEIIIMIGPEGDFSSEEAHLALKNGFIPIHLGESRLRIETAALTAVGAVYLHFLSS